ncbi:MAG: response regulator [Myxococcota bacterium]
MGPLRRCGVLLVESDPDHQWRLARLLTVDGNRGVGTSSGDGALALVAEWPVDLAIVAEDLPGMDGLEVVRRLRELAPSLAVVLMTRPDGPDTRVAAELAGANAVLQKPFRPDVLRGCLSRLPLTPTTGHALDDDAPAALAGGVAPAE